MKKIRKELQEISRLLKLLIRIQAEPDEEKKQNLAGGLDG